MTAEQCFISSKLRARQRFIGSSSHFSKFSSCISKLFYIITLEGYGEEKLKDLPEVGRVRYFVNKKGALGPLSPSGYWFSLTEEVGIGGLETEAWFFLSRALLPGTISFSFNSNTDETSWVGRVQCIKLMQKQFREHVGHALRRSLKRNPSLINHHRTSAEICGSHCEDCRFKREEELV
ncbi:hypothetical protein Tco_1146431 [Tanacetum coccineum]